jgi:hypothetical protein
MPYVSGEVLCNTLENSILCPNKQALVSKEHSVMKGSGTNRREPHFASQFECVASVESESSFGTGSAKYFNDLL